MSPTLRHASALTGSQIWEGDCRQVAAALPSDCASLAIFDGPYGLDKAQWDRLNVGDLAEWYRPHLEDADRVLAPSASLYFWNTSAGWAAVHPILLSMGWTFRSLITWDKGIAFMAGKCDVRGLRTWYDVTEVCGFYQREAWAPSGCAGSEIANAAGADPRNWIRPWLSAEWDAAGLIKRQADEALGTNGMAGHYFGSSQWSLPTWDAFQKLAAYASKHGTTRCRPYLVHPDFWPDVSAASNDRYLRATYDHLRAEYDHLRAEYEASRPAFDCPMGIGNVWTHQSIAGPKRLRAPGGETLHPCQKPLAFSERMILASSRPGDTVWAPFGGTIREAVAAEQVARTDPDQARRVITSELNQDGVDYLGPAIRQLQGLGSRPRNPRQRTLFA